MRLVPVVLVVAACGGGSATPDAKIDGPPDAPPDADPSVHGTWVDTYYVAAGPMMVPSCNTPPAAVVVDPSSGNVTTYTGTCRSDGSFTIHTPDGVTDYYVRVGGSLYATSVHSGLDLGSDQLGRPDSLSTFGVELSLNLTGMETWASADVMMAWAPNNGFYQPLSFDTGAPATNDTTLVATAPWLGDQVDQSRSDTLSIYQLGRHNMTAGGGIGYLTLDRGYDVSAFTMTANTQAHIPPTGSAAFNTPSTGVLDIQLDVPAWDAYASVATPSTAVRTISTTVVAAASPDVTSSPSLFSFATDSSTLGSIDTNAIDYGDPFPTSWGRRARISEAFTTNYTFNFANGSLDAVVAQDTLVSAAEGNPLQPVLSPPLNVMIDSDSAFTATTISATPMVSWSAPSAGAPTDYELTVYEAHVNSTTLTFTQALHLVTKATSVRIPQSYLLPQRQYVFRLTAHTRQGIDVSRTPFKNGAKSYTADVLSALVTTNF